MRPTVARLLEVAAGHLASRTAAALTGYEQATVTMLSLLLFVVGEESQRAVARRVEENGVLRRLFTRALPAVRDRALRDRLETLAAGTDEDLAVAALDASNGALRAALIDLHAHVEASEGPAARAVEAAIWSELRASTERRHVSIAPF
jgi:hypothetical protein